MEWEKSMAAERVVDKMVQKHGRREWGRKVGVKNCLIEIVYMGKK